MAGRNSDDSRSPGRRPDRHRSTGRPSGDGGPARDHQRGKPRGKPKPFRGRNRDGDEPVVLYGWHTVKAALENPQRKFHRILATENAVRRLLEGGVPLAAEPQIASQDEITALAGHEAVHQGLYAEADPLDSPDLEDVANSGVILALDQITDPHNVGAILRSAAAFGVSAMIVTERHSPQASGVLAKAASGALEHVPVVTVVNLSQALLELKDMNVQLIGLDSAGEADLATTPLSDPLALVIGAEGRGLRQLTRARCDGIARLSLPGRIDSLNVSNATALALYIATTRLVAL